MIHLLVDIMVDTGDPAGFELVDVIQIFCPHKNAYIHVCVCLDMLQLSGVI